MRSDMKHDKVRPHFCLLHFLNNLFVSSVKRNQNIVKSTHTRKIQYNCKGQGTLPTPKLIKFVGHLNSDVRLHWFFFRVGPSYITRFPKKLNTSALRFTSY